MVIGVSDNKTYYRNILGYTASITQLKDGRAYLRIRSQKGKIILEKVYKNRRSALIAWNQCEKIKQD